MACPPTKTTSSNVRRAENVVRITPVELSFHVGAAAPILQLAVAMNSAEQGMVALRALVRHLARV
jgi:hypothetical protein